MHRSLLNRTDGTINVLSPGKRATGEALQAYSLGRRLHYQGNEPADVPLFGRAVRLDSNFAMAYASLGTTYSNLGQTSLASENTQKAYELRDRATQREKFYIESHYFQFVTGELEKARQAYELWAQTYPRDAIPPHNLSVIYERLGQYDKALAESRQAFRLDAEAGSNYMNLVASYLDLNRLEEARATAEEALKKNLDSVDLRWVLYLLAFAKNDADGMAQQVTRLAPRH